MHCFRARCTSGYRATNLFTHRAVARAILLTPVPSSLFVVAVHRPRPVHSTSASYLPTIAPKAPSSQISLPHDIVCQNRKRNISCIYIYIFAKKYIYLLKKRPYLKNTLAFDSITSEVIETVRSEACLAGCRPRAAP
jgi:hypothetical protein